MSDILDSSMDWGFCSSSFILLILSFVISEFDNQLVEKAHIDIVCNSIAREWKMLGRQLRLTEGALDCIADDCNQNCKESVYQSLKQWQKIEGPKATVIALQDALLSLGRTDVRDALKKYVMNI